MKNPEKIWWKIVLIVVNLHQMSRCSIVYVVSFGVERCIEAVSWKSQIFFFFSGWKTMLLFYKLNRLATWWKSQQRLWCKMRCCCYEPCGVYSKLSYWYYFWLDKLLILCLMSIKSEATLLHKCCNLMKIRICFHG